jgi:hypothetical protein
MHIYTLPFLAGHTFPLSVLVIFPLTKLFLTCTTSAHWTIDSHLYTPFHFTSTTLIFPELLTTLLVHDVVTPFPLLHPWLVT